MRYLRFCLGTLLMILSLFAYSQKPDMSKFESMRFRSIGPAGMSGRVTSIDVVNSKPQIIYAGTASGGLWKSTTAGLKWYPIFDKEKVLSIGAVTVNQNNPDEIWVGTGEGNPRNSQTSGYGIYKSIDGGQHWKLMGLEKTFCIHRIIIHPQNSNIIYVAALGSAWGDNPERGVYKTIDGGGTWEKVLYQNEKTGAADLVIDPINPNKLIAAMWEYSRKPWFFKSGGKGSGLFITYDGGKTWKQRTNKDGLPAGELGRIGLAIAPSNNKIIYALIESKKNGLYKSSNGGFNWSLVSQHNIGDRPFYYADIFIDPKNENTIYNVYSRVSKSIDGGKSFKVILPYSGTHPDHHAWWMHPNDPDFIIDGNDGGLNISRDGGKSWRFVENLPLAQFYHINVDNEFPYNIYGGMQDNGSWRGPAYVFRSGGIRNSYWQELLFGDGFDVMPDPANSRYGYAMWQGGKLNRYDALTGYTKPIYPNHPDGIALRFGWNAAIAADPLNDATIFMGSQFLHRSNDSGENWEIISPDLTTNDPEKQKQAESGGLTLDVTEAENYTTITAIAASPSQKGIIWVGTDDGNIQLTTDNGKTWNNLTAKIKGIPSGSWINQIHASNHNAGEAFVAINNYRRNNDRNPYLCHTTDFGKTWKIITDKEQVWGYVLSVVQDPIEPKLLFMGTEFGLYFSIDKGENWTKWKNGFPSVSTTDLKIHSREHDLIVGTFGRAIYVMDDIRPIREVASKGVDIFNEELHVFEPPEAHIIFTKRPTGMRFVANATFAGQNRATGARISYSVNIPDSSEIKDTTKTKEKKKRTSVKIEILDFNDTIIRTLEHIPDTGINRIVWNLDQKGAWFPGAARPKTNAKETGGISVMPGKYKIRMTYGDAKDSTEINVKFDPRIEFSADKFIKSHALKADFLKHVELTSAAYDNLREAKKSIDIVLKQIPDDKDSTNIELRDDCKKIKETIDSLSQKIIPIRKKQGIYYSHTDHLKPIINKTWYFIYNIYDAPNTNQIQMVEFAKKRILDDVDKINSFFENEWPEFKTKIESMKLSPFKELEPLTID